MTITGPSPLPPAQLQCYALESEASEHATARVSFTTLLHELLAEHHRCLQEAASSAEQADCKNEAEHLRTFDAATDVHTYDESLKESVTLQVTRKPSCSSSKDSTSEQFGTRNSNRLPSKESGTLQIRRKENSPRSPHSPRSQLQNHGQLSSETTRDKNVQDANQGDKLEFDRQLSPCSTTSHHSKKAGQVAFFKRETEEMLLRTSTLTDPPALPKGSLTCARFLDSPAFELLVACLILINTSVMAAEIQYMGIKAGYVAKFPTFDREADKLWPNADTVFLVVERVFTVVFTVELLLRLAVFRCKLFKVCLNWIDFFAVVVSLLDWVQAVGTFANPMVARLLRLGKLTRGLRLVKLSTVLSSLHLLCKCIAASISTLSWSVCLLLLSQCISGMMLCQLVHEYIMDDSKDLLDRQQVFAYYGTFTRSIITMFEVHLANFGPACRVLLDNVGEEYAYLFLAYRCLAGFAIINVINAVFVQQTISIAQQDQDVSLNEKRKQCEAYSRKLRSFLAKVDTDGDGFITEEEMVSFESDPTYQLWMSTLDIDHADLRGLFRIIDVDQDGLITADELILGASRIKGPAKSVDMIQVLAHLHKLSRKVDTLVQTNSIEFSRQISPMTDNMFKKYL